MRSYNDIIPIEIIYKSKDNWEELSKILYGTALVNFFSCCSFIYIPLSVEMMLLLPVTLQEFLGNLSKINYKQLHELHIFIIKWILTTLGLKSTIKFL